MGNTYRRKPHVVVRLQLGTVRTLSISKFYLHPVRSAKLCLPRGLRQEALDTLGVKKLDEHGRSLVCPCSVLIQSAVSWWVPSRADMGLSTISET